MFFVLVLVEKDEERQQDPCENLAEAFPKEPPPICESRRKVRVHGLLENVEFNEWLHRTDVELAEQVRRGGCQRGDCAGRLHRADFPRKVRGLAADDASSFASRIGLCCGGYRRRVLPPTVRFFGRSSYAFVAALVAVATTLAHGIAPGARLVGAAWSTVVRWTRFSHCDLASRGEWQAVRGRLPVELSVAQLPLSLVEVFGSIESNDAWHSTLRWLSPLTTTPLFTPRMPRAS